MIRQPQIDDAKNFLERVKAAFINQKGVYDKFVEIMKNFKHDKYVPFLLCIWVTASMSFIALVYLTMTRCHAHAMHRLNTGGVIQEVQELFDGHEELFVGFQNFLPATVECLPFFSLPPPLYLTLCQIVIHSLCCLWCRA